MTEGDPTNVTYDTTYGYPPNLPLGMIRDTTTLFIKWFLMNHRPLSHHYSNISEDGKCLNILSKLKYSNNTLTKNFKTRISELWPGVKHFHESF